MNHGQVRAQCGHALLLALVVLSAAASHFLLAALSRARAERDRTTVAALAQAKEALIGFAATYRDTHSDEVFGFLPCPDADNDGIAESSCGAQNVSALGRLPWKTLGIPPLRDSAGECLWYAVSGHAKDGPPKTATMNWDVAGQFVVRDAAGATLAGAAAHDRPLAVIFAPGSVLGRQNRTPSGGGECRGNNSAAAYLDGADAIYAGTPPAVDAASTLTLATADSLRSGGINDQGIWITSQEIFARIKRRSDFKADIDTLLSDAASLLAGLAPAGSKGTGGIGTLCPPLPRSKRKNVRCHWQDNLLYARPAAASTVNGSACEGILIFAGERTAGQVRGDAGEKSVAANYLEGDNALLFPNGGAYRGAGEFLYSAPGADIVRCVAGTAQYSFADDFASFVASGSGVAPDSAGQTLGFAGNGSTTGGCFWFPAAISLAGKTLRSYYEFSFSQADTRAVTGSGTDRGNGFTFQMVRGDAGSPQSVCGKTADMGALALGGPGDAWGTRSIIIETDVRRDTGDADPAANHTAIMANGNLYHTASNGNTTAACNGSAMGCAHTPANQFEESPTPLPHKQRMEIHSGCNAGCASCNPAAHAAPNTYIRIRVWVDCVACADLAANFSGTPSAQRCIDIGKPDIALNSAYFGFSGGFRSGSALQGVGIRNFSLRSE